MLDNIMIIAWYWLGFLSYMPRRGTPNRMMLDGGGSHIGQTCFMTEGFEEEKEGELIALSRRHMRYCSVSVTTCTVSFGCNCHRRHIMDNHRNTHSSHNIVFRFCHTSTYEWHSEIWWASWTSNDGTSSAFVRWGSTCPRHYRRPRRHKRHHGRVTCYAAAIAKHLPKHKHVRRHPSRQYHKHPRWSSRRRF